MRRLLLRPFFRRVAALLLFGCGVLAAPSADASERSQARERFREGVAAYDRGEYEAARASFLQAFAIEPHPSVMLNLGWSCLRAGRRDEAATWFRRYLDEAKDATPEARADAERGVAEAEAPQPAAQPSPSPSLTSARVTAPEEPALQDEPPRPSRLAIDGMVGVADSDLGPGVGVRASLPVVNRLRLGGTVVDHFGHSFTRQVNGVSADGSTAALYLGPEVGWDVPLGAVLVRPYAGIGAAFLSSTVISGVRSTDSETRAIVWPGASIEWVVPRTAFAIGGDLRLVTIPGGPALSAFLTAGARL